MESKKAKDFLPKNKFDQQSLCGIDELSNEEIQPIIYELLTWLQDYNWPVADKVLQVLRKREILTPNGKVQFVKLIGATDAELKALYNKEITVKEIAEKIGSDLTDYTRASVL